MLGEITSFLAKNLKLLSFSFGLLYNFLSFPPLQYEWVEEVAKQGNGNKKSVKKSTKRGKRERNTRLSVAE